MGDLTMAALGDQSMMLKDSLDNHKDKESCC